MGKRHDNKSKREIRSIMSGRVINSNEAILCSEAVDYVKKLGYILVMPKKKALADMTVTETIKMLINGDAK